MKKGSFLLLIIALIISACGNKRHSRGPIDEFYSDAGGFDMGRIPLIKPYEAHTPATNENWGIAVVDTAEIPPQISGVQDVNVIDSTIFIHCKNTYLDNQPVKEAWYVIIPKKMVRGFKTRQEYLSYLDSSKIKVPKMFEITGVFQYFASEDTLDWRKLNREH